MNNTQRPYELAFQQWLDQNPVLKTRQDYVELIARPAFIGGWNGAMKAVEGIIMPSKPENMFKKGN